ncbi:phosphate acetyltransferase [Oceanivirga salmonicida]|uniref:phosphate acetyltransferase n=1 Tax=Oceanivirga salmonicida TaxID=1769291 RepID=UPI0012E28592|nr:phosphate acetyltransferase [Oceanivirga salmonicida]
MSNLIESFKEELKTNKKKVVLPESEDERVLRAAARIQEEDFAEIILVGDEETILSDAKKYGLDISKVEIINPKKFTKIDEFASELEKLRAKKGMTFEKAKEIMLTEPRYFGAMLVRFGYAVGMVAGSNSPTASVLRAAIQVIGVKPGLKTVSSAFVMLLKDNTYGENGTLIFSDCAVIPTPNAEQVADIAISAVQTAKNIGKIKEPKLALLSYSTKGSAGGEVVEKMQEAKRILEQRNVEFEFDGELQLDAAIVPEVAQLKAKNSKVAGNANVLIFPNLSAGNIGYKLVQRLAKAEALGPFIQGLDKPVHDLSRGCSFEDIVGVVAVTAMEGVKNESISNK